MDKMTRELLEQTERVDRLKLIDDTANGTIVQLKVFETDVRVTLTSTNTVTVQLPSVVAAEGITYHIRVITDGGGVTIADQDDSEEWSDLVTDADGEYATVRSNGRQWSVIATDI